MVVALALAASSLAGDYSMCTGVRSSAVLV